MSDDIAIKVEHVSKRYCKSLKRSMLYGIHDIARNMFGLSSHSDGIREKRGNIRYHWSKRGWKNDTIQALEWHLLFVQTLRGFGVIFVEKRLFFYSSCLCGFFA